jgi:hypothetical protein
MLSWRALLARWKWGVCLHVLQEAVRLRARCTPCSAHGSKVVLSRLVSENFVRYAAVTIRSTGSRRSCAAVALSMPSTTTALGSWNG